MTDAQSFTKKLTRIKQIIVKMENLSVSLLYKMVNRSPQETHQLISSLVEDIVNKKMESMIHLVESSQLTDFLGAGQKIHYHSLSDLTKQTIDREGSTQGNNSSDRNQPAKSPASLRPLFKKERIPLNYNKNHRAQTSVCPTSIKHNEYLQSPTDCFSSKYQSNKSDLRSSPLCTFCRQALNLSTCDNIEKSQFLESGKKQKNMGFYSYNFVYTVAPSTEDKSKSKNQQKYLKTEEFCKKSDQKNAQSQDEPFLISQIRNSKFNTLKNSGTQIQSFDFDLTVSQAPKDPLKGERQFSELCLSSLAGQSQSDMNSKKTLVDKEIQAGSKIQALLRRFQATTSVDEEEVQIGSYGQEEYFSNQQSIIENAFDQSNESINIPKQVPSHHNSNHNRQQTSEKKILIQHTLDRQLEQNLAILSNFIAPIDEREKKPQFISRQSVQKDMISDPHELMNETSRRPTHRQTSSKKRTPISKLLDELDVSSIERDSKHSSPSMTLQTNLIKEFEREKQLQSTQPKKLMNRVFDQIEKLKSNQRNKENIPKPLRPPSKSNSQQKPQTIYQQVLSNKKRL